MLVETDMEEMTDEGLRMAALRFVALFRQTGQEEYSRLGDRADELRMLRMLAAPNPYAKEADQMSPISLKELVAKHRALKLAGVTSLEVRNRMILLAYLRALDEAQRARVLSPDPQAQSYLLLCCVAGSDYMAVMRATSQESVNAEEWEEWEPFPFDVNALLPTLDERLLAEIAEIETLPDFQRFMREHDLQAVFEGEPDAHARFPLVKQFAIKEALEECATRLGMTVRKDDDETDSPFDEAASAASDIPRPARDSAFWRAHADKVATEQTRPALDAIAAAFDRGELPLSLFNLTDEAQIAYLLRLSDFPRDKFIQHVLSEGGITTAEAFNAARGDLLCLMDEQAGEGEKLVHPQSDGTEGDASDLAESLQDLQQNIPQNIPHPEVEIAGRAEASNIGPLALGQIRTDGGTQPRAGLNRETVEEYAETIMSNQFPPVVVFYEAGAGGGYWLADGFHRVAAAKRAGKAEIKTEVRKGTRRDAILYSVSANAKHGLRRTDADKRRAVETLLQDEEWSQWSNREIARRCDVTHTFVGNIREELSGSRVQMEAKAVRGGTEYSVSTTNIGGRKKSAPTDSPAEAPPEAEAHIQPEAPTVSATREASLTDTPASPASAGDTTLDSLVAVLRAAGLNGLSRDELLERGFSHSLVEEGKGAGHVASHPNGRLFYSWKGADVVATIRDHGGALSRLELEDLGCQSYAINFAKTDGLIREGKSGKFEIVADALTVTAVAAAAAKAEAGKADPWVQIKRRLGNRALTVTRTFLPNDLGVQLTVNIAGTDATDAINSKLFPASKFARLDAEELELVAQRLDAEKANPKAAAKKKGAGKKSSTQPKAAPVTKRAAKGVAKKGTTAAKVQRIIDSIRSAATVRALDAVIDHAHVKDLSRFGQADAKLIRDAISKRKGQLAKSAKKGAK